MPGAGAGNGQPAQCRNLGPAGCGSGKSEKMHDTPDLAAETMIMIGNEDDHCRRCKLSALRSTALNHGKSETRMITAAGARG